MEVRKEAFHARKSRATSKEEDEDEEDANEPSFISLLAKVLLIRSIFLPTIKGPVCPRNQRVELINEMSNQ